MKLNKATGRNFKQMVVNAPRPAVVLFSSPGCYLCTAVKPILEALSANYKNQLLFYTVDVTAELKLSQTFLDDDDGVPTILFLRINSIKN